MKPLVREFHASEKFNARHQFVLADGRRFASLFCAANSVINNDDAHSLLPVCRGKEQFGFGFL